MTTLKTTVLIPAITIAAGTGKLNEPYAAFYEAPCDQAVAAKGGSVSERIVEDLALHGMLGLALDIHQLRYGRLHAEGQLMVGDG